VVRLRNQLSRVRPAALHPSIQVMFAPIRGRPGEWLPGAVLSNFGPSTYSRHVECWVHIVPGSVPETSGYPVQIRGDSGVSHGAPIDGNSCWPPRTCVATATQEMLPSRGGNGVVGTVPPGLDALGKIDDCQNDQNDDEQADEAVSCGDCHEHLPLLRSYCAGQTRSTAPNYGYHGRPCGLKRAGGSGAMEGVPARQTQAGVAFLVYPVVRAPPFTIRRVEVGVAGRPIWRRRSGPAVRLCGNGGGTLP